MAISAETDVDLEGYTGEILRSGFPGLRNLAGRPLRVQLDSYIQRVVDRDFPELGHSVRNPDGLRRWMAAYAAATATTTSFEKIRNASTGGEDDKPARGTVVPYRDVLGRLFILDPVPAWQPTRRHIRELASPPKPHLADPALAGRLLGATASSLLAGESSWPVIPRDGPLLGALLESLVTLSARLYAQANAASVGHFRTHRGEHEVDLVVQRATVESSRSRSRRRRLRRTPICGIFAGSRSRSVTSFWMLPSSRRASTPIAVKTASPSSLRRCSARRPPGPGAT